MSELDLLRRLCEQLSLDDGWSIDTHLDESPLLTRFDGQILNPPVHLRFSELDLEQSVRAVDQSDIDQLWPGSAREWAAFALLSVHIEEELRTRVGITELRLAKGILASDGSEPILP